MKFIRSALILLVIFSGSFSYAANNYQDWWWNPAQSGMGLNIGQQNDTIFVAWFNYGDDTKASFLTMGGVLNGNTLTGPLLRNTGPVPGPNYNPALVKQTTVGTATITFNTNNDATLTYSYDNKGGTMALQRFSFASPNLNQTWTALNTSTTTGCENASLNESTAQINLIKGQQIVDSKFSMTSTNLDGTNLCVLMLTPQLAGSRMTATGQVQCEGGSGATVLIDDFTIQSDYLNFSYLLSNGTAPGERKSCVSKGKMSGVVKTATSPTFDLAKAFQNRLLQGFSKTFNVTGDCKGTMTATSTPGMKTTWQGQPVYAVNSTQNFNLPNCSLGVFGTQTSTNYYDMNFKELAMTGSDGSYSEYVVSSEFGAVKVGDTGTLGTWHHLNNNSRSQERGTTVNSFAVEPDTASTALLNAISRNYNTNQLVYTAQYRFKLNANATLEWLNLTIDFASNQGHLFFQ
jgi:hypothetical protein